MVLSLMKVAAPVAPRERISPEPVVTSNAAAAHYSGHGYICATVEVAV